MNILMVSPLFPTPTSGQNTRNFHLLKTLASYHHVSLLALENDTEKISPDHLSLLSGFTENVQIIAIYANSPKRWKQVLGLLRGVPHVLQTFIFPEVQQALDVLFATYHFDAVLYESMYIANYRLPENVIVMLDEHNIEFELRLRTYQQEKAFLRKWYNWLEGHLLKFAEIERCRRANVILMTSEREQIIMQQLLPTNNFVVVPNGVDSTNFLPADVSQEVENSIVFTGAMGYYPNVDAVRFFAHHCWPLIRARIPTATWQIVGKNPMAEVLQLANLPGVTVTGEVPDTRPYLATASLAIAPLRIGSGTRLKILEAFSMQKAVVASSIGCEGLAVEAGQHLLVADQPEAFAEAVIELLQQPEKRRSFGCAGRALVETTYSWKQCGKYLLQAVAEMESNPV
ncbi:MAG: glycosyltransferase [Ktedonobacteraceae bacterium]